MVMADSTVDFPCIAIFRSGENEPPQNFDSDRNDCLGMVFRSMSYADIKKKILCLDEDRRSYVDDPEPEKIYNVKLEITADVIDKLRSLTFSKKSDRATDYEKSKDAFFKLLSNAIDQCSNK